MTSSTPPRFSRKDRIDSLFDKKQGEYPTQLSATPVADYGGELRGYYPGDKDKETKLYKGTWKPHSSSRVGRGGAHNGADIFTGYAPYPLETPILAATDGTLVNMSDAENPNDAGNRVGISTSIGDDRIDFRYGHLSRFARPPGLVEKGDLIGYAGCSGNADTAGECSEEGPCGLTSCHVHLITAQNGDFSSTPDPVRMLRWKLNYQTGTYASEKSCAEIKPLSHDFEPKRGNGVLGIGKENLHRRTSGQRRKPLIEPFSNIHFDDSSRLRASQAAYENLRTRLTSTITTHSAGPSTFGADLMDFMAQTWTGKLKHARNDPKTVQGRALAVLKEEINLITANTAGQALGGAATRALLAGARALWLLAGGAAIREGMSNRVLYDLWLNSGVNTFRKKKNLFSNNPLRIYDTKTIRRWRKGKLKTQTVAMSPPQCGLGVDGWATLVASDHGCVAVHRCSLPVEVDALGVKGSDTAISLDFGTLSLMQTVWPMNMAGTFPLPNEDDPDPDAAARDFCSQVSHCISRFWLSYNRTYLTAGALNLEDASDERRVKAASDLADSLQGLHDDIRTAYDNFLSLDGLTAAEKATRLAQIKRVLDHLTIYNTALSAQAVVRSAVVPEGPIPITPSLTYLAMLDETKSQDEGHGA